MNVMIHGRHSSIIASFWRFLVEDVEAEDTEYHLDTEQDQSILRRLKDTFSIR